MTPEQVEKIIKRAIDEGISFPWWSYLVMLLCVFFGALLGSYFKIKGENIATKEDVGEITKLVEEAKQSFNSELEHLRCKLNVISGTEINLLTEERNAIVNFKTCYYDWFATVVHRSLTYATKIENTDNINYFEIYDAAYQKFIQAEVLLDLFVKNNKLKELCNELKNRTLSLIGTKHTNFVNDIVFINIDFQHTKEAILKETDAEKREEKLSSLTELNEKRLKRFDEFQDEILEIQQEIMELQHKFNDSLKNHLYTILK